MTATLRQLRPDLPPAAIGGLAAAAVIATGSLSAFEPTDGALSVAVALLLAPVAVLTVVLIGERLGGPRFAAAAGVFYVVLPFVARYGFYGPFLPLYEHQIAPALVGVRATGWFALGVAAALAVVARPRVAAVAGVIAFLAGLILWADTDWSKVFANFHETTWSPTLVSALPFACILAVGLRSPLSGAALGGWIGFFILRGADRPYGSGAFWLSLAAATPAAAVLLTSLALLVPPLRRWRLAEPTPVPADPGEVR